MKTLKNWWPLWAPVITDRLFEMFVFSGFWFIWVEVLINHRNPLIPCKSSCRGKNKLCRDLFLFPICMWSIPPAHFAKVHQLRFAYFSWFQVRTTLVSLCNSHRITCSCFQYMTRSFKRHLWGVWSPNCVVSKTKGHQNDKWMPIVKRDIKPKEAPCFFKHEKSRWIFDCMDCLFYKKITHLYVGLVIHFCVSASDRVLPSGWLIAADLSRIFKLARNQVRSGEVLMGFWSLIQ